MNPEIKAQWLAALRSGEYAQGRGSLKTDSGDYCCLGVLCQLAVDQGVVDEYSEFCTKTSYPSGMVVEWSGIPTFNPVVDGDGYHTRLATLNDVQQYSFAKIADIIEAQL